MASLNKVVLMGNITKDLELKQTTSGIAVTTFSIAINRNAGKDKEKQTDFINIVAWRQTAEFICKWFSKGKPILICGHIATRSYEDKNGNKRTATEVVADEAEFVGGKTEESKGEYVPEAYTEPHFETVSAEDDLPF